MTFDSAAFMHGPPVFRAAPRGPGGVAGPRLEEASARRPLLGAALLIAAALLRLTLT